MKYKIVCMMLCMAMAVGVSACGQMGQADAGNAAEEVSGSTGESSGEDSGAVASDDGEKKSGDEEETEDDWYEELDKEGIDPSVLDEEFDVDDEDATEPDKASVPSDLSHGMTLSYPQIDPAGLDNAAIPWGMGPDRDELNRPITALQYQENYKDYNVDFIVPSEDKKLYLTFDEGYENGFSESMLDTLKRHNAQGIFFVTKSYAESRPDLVQRMIDDGHIVGNHTVHHPSDGMQAHDIAYQTNEVKELHDYIKDNFGYDMFLFRYPTGMFSKQSLAVVSNCGYRSVFWSFAYADWDRDKQPDPTEALAKLESSLHPGAIYLLHAVSQTNESILDEFLSYVEAQGYEVGNYAETLE